MRRALIALAGVIVLVGGSCSTGSDGGQPGTTQSTVTVSRASSLYYGEAGRLAPGDTPDHCPPPLSGMMRDSLLPRGALAIWRDDLHGGRCYGSGGVYDSCGDGYGDEFAADPPDEGGACEHRRVTGLPYALTPDQRTANAVTAIGGECFSKLVGDELELSDCRRPHIGRVVWGNARQSGDENLHGICDANDQAWKHFTKPKLISTGKTFACVVLLTNKPDSSKAGEPEG